MLSLAFVRNRTVRQWSLSFLIRDPTSLAPHRESENKSRDALKGNHQQGMVFRGVIPCLIPCISRTSTFNRPARTCGFRPSGQGEANHHRANGRGLCLQKEMEAHFVDWGLALAPAKTKKTSGKQKSRQNKRRPHQSEKKKKQKTKSQLPNMRR